MSHFYPCLTPLCSPLLVWLTFVCLQLPHYLLQEVFLECISKLSLLGFHSILCFPLLLPLFHSSFIFAFFSSASFLSAESASYSPLVSKALAAVMHTVGSRSSLHIVDPWWRLERYSNLSEVLHSEWRACYSDWHVHTTIFQVDNQQGPTVQQGLYSSLYSTAQGTLLNILYNLHGKRIWKRIDICVSITESLCCTPETNTTLWNNSIVIKLKNKTKQNPKKAKSYFSESSVAWRKEITKRPHCRNDQNFFCSSRWIRYGI